MQAAAAEQLASQPVMGPDGTPLPVGAVGVNAEGLPVNANGEVVVAEDEIEIAEGLKRFERN